MILGFFQVMVNITKATGADYSLCDIGLLEVGHALLVVIDGAAEGRLRQGLLVRPGVVECNGLGLQKVSVTSHARFWGTRLCWGRGSWTEHTTFSPLFLCGKRRWLIIE